MSESTKIAIILRGPPGVGKTEALKKLSDRLKIHIPIVLDNGWNPGETRFKARTSGERYRDLLMPILLVELAYGEPAGEKTKGATKNPSEWIGVLVEAGYSVKIFLLTAAEEVRLDRTKKDKHRNAGSDLRVAKLYAPGEVCSHEKFDEQLQREGVTERVIDTSGMKAVEVAEKIAKLAGVPLAK